MEMKEGVSFIIINKEPGDGLRAQMHIMNELCSDLGCDYEIIVYHRSQSDRVENIISNIKDTRQIRQDTINFYSSALRAGLKCAQYEKLVLCFSEDIITSNSVKQMVLGLRYYDLICGIRPVLKGGMRASIYNWGWHKLVRFLFGVRLKDIDCPYKALLRSKAVEVGYLESDGSLTHTELIARAKAMGMKVAEFPLEIFHRESEKSEVHNPLVLIWTFYRLVKLRMQISKTRKRLANEAEFHDAWASNMDINRLLVHESFEAVTAIENRYAVGEMGDITGRRILDLGCGAGEASVYFALKGAQVTAADISNEMLNVANRLADKWNVKIDTKLITGEDMNLQSNCCDYVFGNGVLHHLDRKKAYDEIYRVLKPGGRAIFIEPLCYNPVISIYRLLAKTVRTKNEEPFSFRDFRYLKKLFPCVKHTEFWLATQLIFIYFFVVKRISPRKERYWKKVIADADGLAPAYKKLLKVDNFLLKRIPFLRRFCWNTVIVLGKAPQCEQ